jgi:hypothetical protein
MALPVVAVEHLIIVPLVADRAYVVTEVGAAL